MPLRDGVARLLDEAERVGRPLAIASTTTRANIDALLCTGISGRSARPRFAVIGAAGDAAHKKPRADIYEHRAARARRIAAAECVAIEDSANGLRAAKARGCSPWSTPSYWTRAEDFSGADLVLPSLGSADIRDAARGRVAGSYELGIREICRQAGTGVREFGYN